MAAGDMDAGLLRSQITPWPTPTLRRRLAEHFRVTTDPETAGREVVMAKLLDCYARAGPRRIREVSGAPMRRTLVDALLVELRRMQLWDDIAHGVAVSERPKVRSSGYLTLNRPPPQQQEQQEQQQQLLPQQQEEDGDEDEQGEQDQDGEKRQHGSVGPAGPKLTKQEKRTLRLAKQKAVRLKSGSKSQQAEADKLRRHKALWDLAATAIFEVDPEYAAS